MKLLTNKEANEYLCQISMKIGDWNEIKYISDDQLFKPEWINFERPEENQDSFALHVSGWLPKGSWVIFQIDNSTGTMCPFVFTAFWSLLFGIDNIPEQSSMFNKTIFLEFGKSDISDENIQLVISHLISLILKFELHSYVVSSACNTGQCLGLQDGFVYFSSKNDRDLSDARQILDAFKEAPNQFPDWYSDIFVRRQEESVKQ